MAVEKLILLVEDNPDEEVLTLGAMKKCKGNASVVVAHDGCEALEYLLADGKEAGKPRFVLLDLNIPRLDGFDVIARLRADPRTRPLPVVVFSSSSEGQDVRRCNQLGANSYVMKPVAAEQYREAVSRIVHYWLNLNLDPCLRS